MQDGHIRLNKVTREWVIYAPSRRKRPQDFQQSSRDKKSLVSRDPKCPFCPGNEHMSDSIILEIPNKQHKCWQTRVVPTTILRHLQR
jgi:UDPglucose--hexose-1-phosphate uridylyltransferase